MSDQNISVLSSYRVGSTALCDFLSQKYDLIDLGEFFHPERNNNSFLFSNDKQKFIVKIMPDHYERHSVIKKILSDSFVISIFRRDVVAQISSFYICHMTKRWHQLRKECCNDYVVPIDQFELENQIRYILNMNNLQKELSSRYSKVFYFYEDINDELGASKFDIYHKPTNYKDIYNYISLWIAKQGYYFDKSC